jgi:glycosyltransferase involved in cell wall biosynthesis
MKLLIVASSLDLRQPFSATPAWWQLLKGLYEIGVDVLATTYQGPAIETLWWRALPNPVRAQGDAFKAVRALLKRSLGKEKPVETVRSGETRAERLQRELAQRVIMPRWRAFMDRTFRAHPDVDAVIFLTIPLNHVVGLAAHVQSKFGKPVLYYDGDVPASLPQFAGFASGFKMYYGADVREYTAFISNSYGGAQLLRDLGVRQAHVLYYGADPDVFSPVDVPKDIDVFFYGHTREYREEWIDGMLSAASRAMPEARFAVRGRGLGSLGRAQMLPYLSFSKLREYACRAKINLCITRKAHASVFASSSARPFELASLGACIVANPYLGVETWFEPGREIIVVQSAEEAVERYRWLLANDSARQAIGAAARQRLLAEHTFQQRARELVQIVKQHV